MTLDMPGADLPGAADPTITDVIPAALAAIDPTLPGASAKAARALGMPFGLIIRGIVLPARWASRPEPTRCCSSSSTASATSS